MKANNWQRMNIWLELDNKFDYSKFSEACKADGCEPLQPLEFGQKAGMILTGAAMYPDLPATEAYIRLLSDHRQESTPPVQQQSVSSNHQTTKTGCSSCGGGKTR
jgi:hypothetical protein